MNRDDIIRMAREVADVETDSRGRETFTFDCYGVERLAAIYAAAEREACAQIVEREAMTYSNPVWAVEIVNDIRARGPHSPAYIKPEQMR